MVLTPKTYWKGPCTLDPPELPPHPGSARGILTHPCTLDPLLERPSWSAGIALEPWICRSNPPPPAGVGPSTGSRIRARKTDSNSPQTDRPILLHMFCSRRRSIQFTPNHLHRVNYVHSDLSSVCRAGVLVALLFSPLHTELL